MDARTPQFLASIKEISNLKEMLKGKFFDGRPHSRVVFAGRSNVGKSSLLNALTQSQIAKTSKSPGHTRALNFFWVPEFERLLVDMPGFGYAQVSQTERESWRKLIDFYFGADEALDRVFLLVDSRHGMGKIDQEAIEYFVSLKLPLVIVLTKTDAIKNQSERSKRKKLIEQIIQDLNCESVPLIWSSVKKGQGIKELRGYLK